MYVSYSWPNRWIKWADFFEETHGYTILFKFHGQRWALPLVIHKRMHIIKPLSKKEKSFK